MLFLLSPAKSLDYETPPHLDTHTLPVFIDRSAELIGLLRQKSPAEIASLMKLSDPLAALNVARYAAWSPKFGGDNSKQAILAFDGDVYEGLDAKSLDAGQLDWAQRHVAMLSGLYGVLRPLDWMQPYRLEMGTKLPNARGKDLYAFWGTTIAEHLDGWLASDPSPLIVNLASEEYFKAVDRRALKAPVLQCVFEEWKGAGWKIVSFHAKRARGLMTRFAIEQRCTRAAQLKAFDREGYAFDAAASDDARYVFRRRAG